MPAKSKQQQKFMGIVHAIQKGDAKASDYSKEIRAVAKSMKKKDVKDFADTDRKGLPKKVKEALLSENPAAMAAAAMATVKMKNAQGKQIKGTSALQSKDPQVKKKAKGIFQRLKDKFSKKKDDKKPAPKKQSKSDTDFYKRQFAGESVNEDNIKFSKEEMAQLHNDGQIEKDGIVIVYDDSVKEDRDYKAEYKKYGSSTKAKKYRAELNQYNRKKGTYGNGDGKDASHRGGKIVGFEKESTNRGRAEKSRLKKESVILMKNLMKN